MANVKISNAPPFGLPTGADLTGNEWIPMDQTVGSITTTIKAQLRIAVTAAGNFTLPQPASGPALTINSISGTYGIRVIGGSVYVSDATPIIKSVVSAAGVGNYSLVSAQNDNATHRLDLGATSTTYSGAYLTGGPSGESGFLTTSWAGSLALGTNKIAALVIGTNQAVTINAPSSGSALTVQGASNFGGALGRSTSASGYLSGNYPSVETVATPGVIYSLGPSYVPNTGANPFGTTYGIGYCRSDTVQGTTGTTTIAAKVGAPTAHWGQWWAATGTVTAWMDANNGSLYLQSGGAFYINGVKQPVFSAAITGYGTPTGAARQPSFDATTITLVNLAKAVAQLINDLKTQLILAA